MAGIEVSHLAEPFVNLLHRRNMFSHLLPIDCGQLWLTDLQIAQPVVFFRHTRTLTTAMVFQNLNGLLPFSCSNKKTLGTFVKNLADFFVFGRIAYQRQVVRGVGAGARETKTFNRFGNRIRQLDRILIFADDDAAVLFLQITRHGNNGPGKCRRITAININWFKTIQAQMFTEPAHTTGLGHGGALVNTTTVGNHDWHHQTTVLTAPPARSPVAATLLFKGTIT